MCTWILFRRFCQSQSNESHDNDYVYICEVLLLLFSLFFDFDVILFAAQGVQAGLRRVGLAMLSLSLPADNHRVCANLPILSRQSTASDE